MNNFSATFKGTTKVSQDYDIPIGIIQMAVSMGAVRPTYTAAKKPLFSRFDVDELLKFAVKFGRTKRTAPVDQQDHLEAYATDCLYTDDHKFIFKFLYANYTEWCAAHKVKPFTDTYFCLKVKELYPLKTIGKGFFARTVGVGWLPVVQ